MSKSLDASPSTAPEAALIGRDLAGRYRIESRVGAGGFGIVYRAWDHQHRGPVAVKVLREEFFGRKAQRGRFDREARALVNLSHPHIVSVTDFGVDGDMPFLVMELLEGHALDMELKRRGALSIPRCFRLVQQLLAGLGYIHDRDLVHRDVKPANIFLHHTADGIEQLKLLDFGLAKFMDLSQAEGPTLTRAGDVFGTPGYMPPEQLASEDVDRRADLYGAGVVLYEMLTGRRPFSGPAHEVLRMVLVDPPPPIRSVCPTRFPHPALEETILKSLAKAPEERFQSANDFATALAQIPEPPIVDLAGKVEGSRESWSPDPVDHPAQLTPGHGPAVAHDNSHAGDPPFSFSSLTSSSTANVTRQRHTTVWRRLRHRWACSTRGTQYAVLASALGLAGVLAFALLGSPDDSTQAGLGAAELGTARGQTAQTRLESAGADSSASAREADGTRSGTHAALSTSGSRSPGAAARTASVEEVKAVSAGSAATQPPPRDPFAGPLPRTLERIRTRLAEGKASSRAVTRLRRYNLEHPDDPRGNLLLGRILLVRDQPREALAQFNAALERDPSAHGDVHLLKNLLELATTVETSTQATALVEATYRASTEELVKQALREATSDAERHELMDIRNDLRAAH